MTVRRVRLVAAGVVALTLMGADGGCRGGEVDTDRPPADRQVDTRRERVVLIRAYGDGPYTVRVIASEMGKSGRDSTGPVPVAAGEYRQTLSYTSGLRIVVSVRVTGSESDRFHCQIIDGSNTTFDEGYGAAFCTVTTRR